MYLKLIKERKYWSVFSQITTTTAPYKNKIIKKKPVSKKLTGFRSDIGVIKKRKYYFFIRLRASRAKGLLTDSLNVTCHANGLPFIASEAYTTPL